MENHRLSFTQVTWASATSAHQAFKLPPSKPCDQFNADFPLGSDMEVPRLRGAGGQGGTVTCCLLLTSRPRRRGLSWRSAVRPSVAAGAGRGA